MRKLILKMSVSVDGFVGGPNGEIEWLLKSLDEGAMDWILNTLWQAGVHIMGCRTFYDMVSYWPYSTEPLAAPMNKIPKIVFSRKGVLEPVSEMLTTTALKDSTRLDAAAGLKPLPAMPPHAANWAAAKVIGGDLASAITLLKQEPGKDILAHGGARFARSLAKTGLIDEYQLLTHPVVLGMGLPLFSAIAKPIDLKLVSVTSFHSGAVAHVYRPV